MTADTTIFGDWSQVVFAEFGSGVDIVAYPYSLALTGMIRVHAARLVDVGVRHGAAFFNITALSSRKTLFDDLRPRISSPATFFIFSFYSKMF